MRLVTPLLVLLLALVFAPLAGAAVELTAVPPIPNLGGGEDDDGGGEEDEDDDEDDDDDGRGGGDDDDEDGRDDEGEQDDDDRGDRDDRNGGGDERRDEDEQQDRNEPKPKREEPKPVAERPAPSSKPQPPPVPDDDDAADDGSAAVVPPSRGGTGGGGKAASAPKQQPRGRTVGSGEPVRAAASTTPARGAPALPATGKARQTANRRQRTRPAAPSSTAADRAALRTAPSVETPVVSAVPLRAEDAASTTNLLRLSVFLLAAFLLGVAAVPLGLAVVVAGPRALTLASYRPHVVGLALVLLLGALLASA